MELNFVGRGTRAALLVGLLACGNPAFAGTITHPNPPDPLLDGGPTNACTAGADYSGGTDVNGHAVAPAEVTQGRTPVPNSIAIPLARGSGGARLHPAGGESAYVTLDGQKLDRLVNPPPCR